VGVYESDDCKFCFGCYQLMLLEMI
jgi:hypothetical protein